MRICFAIVALALCACQATEPLVVIQKAQDETLVRHKGSAEKDRQKWTGKTTQFLERSKTTEEERSWILGYIPFTIGLVRKVSLGCSEYELLSVTEGSIAAFEVKDWNGLRRSHQPLTYLETWTVSSCGTLSTWRVFDESIQGQRDTKALVLDFK